MLEINKIYCCDCLEGLKQLVMGSGTTAMVALQNQRNYIGFELNPTYVDMANKRISNVQIKIV